ncbi:hypothetical protein [Kordiimonas sp.]|uniref:hypothetical protein n=1 Tax=Kordiimonas sp. TaxID=1970157 RepID=UPI003B52702D
MTTTPGDRRRIILHLGAPKTGSTSLQYYLAENTGALERAGIVYPERMIQHGKVDMLHTHLVQMRTRSKPEAAFAAARARLNTLFEKSGAHSLLLSNESLLGEPYHADKAGFFPHHAKWVAELKRLFEDYDVDVIYFTRSFESFLPSYYVQYVRKGGALTLKDFCAHVRHGDISWCPLVASLKVAFGDENVRIFDHAALKDKPADTIRATFGRYAPALPDFNATEYNQNPSVGGGVLAAYRLLNRLFSSIAPHARQRHLRPKMRKYLFAPLAGFSNKQPPKLPAAEAAELRALFEQDRAALGLENKR